MFVQPRMLSILTTRRCTAACDHCCIGSSPQAREAIPVERIHGLIEEARRIPSIELIGFTGGECFLLGKDLDALVGHAARVGFTTRVITNGYWAVNERGAEERIVGLRTAGLNEMVLSTGTFHQQFVPVQRVVYAARASCAAGVATCVTVEDCDQSTFDGTALDQLMDLVLAGRLRVSRHAWITDLGGRGKMNISHERLIAENPDAADGPCRQILDIVSVTPDQDVKACCGFPLEQLPRLRLGSVVDRALEDMIGESSDDLLKMWLHIDGPSKIGQFIARHVPGFVLPPSSSICQSCATLQRDERAMRCIAQYTDDILPLVTQRYIAAREQVTRHISPQQPQGVDTYVH